MGRIKEALRRSAACLSAALLLAGASPALANHGDIHARCVNGEPVVTVRPPGTEYVKVICRGGLPRFMVEPEAPPTYDPVTSARSQPTPPDFGGWVTVWLNGRPLVAPYDPVRQVQEPGAYLSASTGRVMMPVRFFTAAFGGAVDWSDESRRARLFLGGKLLQIWLESEYAMINAYIARLDQPPVLFQGRLFVPVRFLMEGFGAQVDWDHGNRSARVTLPGAACKHPVYCGEVR